MSKMKAEEKLYKLRGIKQIEGSLNGLNTKDIMLTTIENTEGIKWT